MVKKRERFKHYNKKVLVSPYRHLSISIFLILALIASGTIGYSIIEHWSFLDALYMTIITTATVGFKEVTPLSTSGVVFTSILILVGVAVFAITFGSISELFVRGTFQDYLGRTRMQKELKKLNHHYIICGYGRMGKIIAGQFINQDISFVVVDADESAIKDAREDEILSVFGDAGHEEVLIDAGIENAKGLVCSCTNDAVNLMVTITARGLNEAMFIVARAEDPKTEKKLQQVGADKIISPYYLGALRISQAVLRPAALNFIEISTLNHEFGLTVDELPIGENSKLQNLTVQDSSIKKRFDVMVLCVTNKDGTMNFNPSADSKMNKGDKLILMGDHKNLARLAEWSGV